jgi:hypothetical protein
MVDALAPDRSDQSFGKAIEASVRTARSLQCQDAISPGDSLLISRGLWTLGQFASKTGESAFAKTCWVAPPKIICLNRLCV